MLTRPCSYLEISLLGFGIVLIMYSFAPGTRKMMFLSGTAFIPFSLLGFLHEHTYWNPHRVNGSGWGLEDILFSFSIGSLVWFFAEKPFRLKLSPQGCARMFLWRVGGIGALATAGTLTMVPVLGAMGSTILGHSLVLGYLLSKKPQLFLLAFSTVIWYPLYYFCVLNIFLHFLDPNFLSIWNGTELWGIYFQGIPLEEYLWVISFSASWTLLIAYGVDIRIIRNIQLAATERPRINDTTSKIQTEMSGNNNFSDIHGDYLHLRH